MKKFLVAVKNWYFPKKTEDTDNSRNILFLKRFLTGVILWLILLPLCIFTLDLDGRPMHNFWNWLKIIILSGYTAIGFVYLFVALAEDFIRTEKKQNGNTSIV